MAIVRQRIEVSLEDEVLQELNQHCQVSPLSRSEIVAIALRRLFREERRKATVEISTTEMARKIAIGELPSRVVDANVLHTLATPTEN